MARRDDLSTPRGTPGGPVYDPDAFGAIAERLARFFGTPRYLVVQTVHRHRLDRVQRRRVVWRCGLDPYPFILLNLAFSTQAAYAAPLILLAQNRQADRDKAEVERDRETNARSLAETEYLAREIAAVRLARRPEGRPRRDLRGARAPHPGGRTAPARRDHRGSRRRRLSD